MKSRSADGIIPTSPIVGSREERQAISRRKGQRQRAITKAAQKLTSLEQSQENKAAIFDEILEKLSSHGLTFGQVMLYVFDPVYKQGSSRWDGFFKERGLATKIMNFWVSKQNSTTARQEVAAEMRKEGREITASKVLQTAGSPIDYEYFTGFSIVGMGEYLRSAARISFKMFSALATSARTLRADLAERSKKRFSIITSAVLELLGEYSHKNNYSRHMMGLYLYVTGAQRQTISVMAHLGISESYQSITHKPHAEELAARINGLISTNLARGVASTGLFAGVYDNINMMFRAAEQVMGRT
ncbi:hypothetical protein B0H14DRAFT_3084919 [Mycena olivaceomarginata]|nr:hypothetical protein B0H14DRAFT_3084919 [Mycena olivaceomarginata]